MSVADLIISFKQLAGDPLTPGSVPSPVMGRNVKEEEERDDDDDRNNDEGDCNSGDDEDDCDGYGASSISDPEYDYDS